MSQSDLEKLKCDIEDDQDLADECIADLPAEEASRYRSRPPHVGRHCPSEEEDLRRSTETL